MTCYQETQMPWWPIRSCQGTQRPWWPATREHRGPDDLSEAAMKEPWEQKAARISNVSSSSHFENRKLLMRWWPVRLWQGLYWLPPLPQSTGNQDSKSPSQQLPKFEVEEDGVCFSNTKEFCDGKWWTCRQNSRHLGFTQRIRIKKDGIRLYLRLVSHSLQL